MAGSLEQVSLTDSACLQYSTKISAIDLLQRAAIYRAPPAELKIATLCNRLIAEINEELVGYCKQAESVRETCSRDPANNYLDILLQVNWIF